MYIEQEYRGLSESWRYVIGLILIFIGWQFIGMIPLGVFLIDKYLEDGYIPLDIKEMSEILGNDIFLFLMLLPFAIGLLAIFLTVKFLHRQSILSLTTSRKKIDWKRVVFAFVLWAFISLFMIGIDIYLSPEDYVFNFEFGPFMVLLAISVILIPLQTSFEEYFLRGYLMQGIGIMAKNRWFPLVITSTIFGLLHIFNPEVEKLGYLIMVFYIGTGFFLGILTLMDEGLELSLGFHAANNLITVLLVTANWTAFQTDSIYRDVSDPVLGWEVFVPVFIIYPILLVIFSKKYGWTNWKERLTAKVLSKKTLLESIGNDMEQ